MNTKMAIMRGGGAKNDITGVMSSSHSSLSGAVVFKSQPVMKGNTRYQPSVIRTNRPLKPPIRFSMLANVDELLKFHP